MGEVRNGRNVIVSYEQAAYVCIMTDKRKLRDLFSVGPAIERDLALLGITEVGQLKGRTADELYEQLQTATGVRQDPCVYDTFRAAIAQAEDPNLPEDQCRWWYWSNVRKGKQGR